MSARSSNIEDTASSFVEELLSDGVVDGEDQEIFLLLSIINTCTYHIHQIRNKAEA